MFMSNDWSKINPYDLAEQIVSSITVTDHIDQTITIDAEKIGTLCMDSPDVKPMLIRKYWQTEGGYTTVEWIDGTKTTVKSENPENNDIFTAVCIAYAKKAFGSTNKIIKAIDQAKKNTEWPKRKKEIEREKQKAMKKELHDRRKAMREREIQRAMHDIEVKNEAHMRLINKEEKMYE